MSTVGSWNVNIEMGALPQKIATAFDKLGEELIGAEYTAIAYLGSQVVNGTNHAVLAEQTVLAGKDTKNIVLVIFNEKADVVTLVNIERVVEGGGELGGNDVNVQTDIPDEAKAAFDSSFAGFVGSTVKPVALLATKVTKGTSYVFVAEVAPVVPDPEKKVAIVAVNGMTKDVAFADLLTSKLNGSLGYAFNW